MKKGPEGCSGIVFWNDVAVEEVNKPELQRKRCETVRVLRTLHLMAQCGAMGWRVVQRYP